MTSGRRWGGGGNFGAMRADLANVGTGNLFDDGPGMGDANTARDLAVEGAGGSLAPRVIRH